MIDDPAILANILLVLFTGLFLVIAWLVLSTIARWIVSGVSRDDEPEPETHGDDGGRPEPVEEHRPRPKAPQKGCGRPVGIEDSARMRRREVPLPTSEESW